MVVSIIGLGGTGSFLIEPLIRFMNSKGLVDKIIFVDGDSYEDKNADRQLFSTSYVGTNKAEYAYIKFTKLFPDLISKLQFIPDFIGKEQLPSVMVEGGAMFICVDNHWFRRIADEHCATMKEFLMISGGNELVTGNVQVVQMIDGINITKNTISSRHSDVANADPSEDRSEMTCEQVSKLPGGGQIIVANMMSAALMLCHYISFTNSPTKRPVYESFFDCLRTEVSSREVK